MKYVFWVMKIFFCTPVLAQSNQFLIKQNFLNTRSKTEYIQRNLSYTLDPSKLSFELNRVKEYNLVTYQETAANDSLKMPVTYEIDYDTDNPVADNELEELIIPDKMGLINKTVKYIRSSNGYQVSNSKNKNLLQSIYFSLPQLNKDFVLNTIRFEVGEKQKWIDSTYTTHDNGGVYINHFQSRTNPQSSLKHYDISGVFIGNPVDLTSLPASTERIRYTVNVRKEYTGFVVCTSDGFIQELKLTTRSEGFNYTLHEGLKNTPFDYTITSYITNEIR